MSLESRHVINVTMLQSYLTWDGKPAYSHFFRIETDFYEPNARPVIKAIKEKFPEPDYKVTVIFWDIKGQDVTDRFK